MLAPPLYNVILACTDWAVPRCNGAQFFGRHRLNQQLPVSQRGEQFWAHGGLAVEVRPQPPKDHRP
jgi:hypothetical protein